MVNSLVIENISSLTGARVPEIILEATENGGAGAFIGMLKR